MILNEFQITHCTVEYAVEPLLQRLVVLGAHEDVDFLDSTGPKKLLQDELSEEAGGSG
jgi:hypothetical protein